MADLQKKNQEMIANIENIMTTTESTMKKTNINSAATPLKSDKQALAVAESKATPALAAAKQEKMPSSIRNTSSSNPVTPLEEQISEGN